MKITYLTWGETPRSYGVFGTQVIAQFIATKKLMPDAEFQFISAIPLIHSGMVREKLRYPAELKKVKEKLNKIQFIRIPIYAPQTIVNPSKLNFRLMQIGAQYHLAKQLKKQKPDIVHCRGYAATYAALQIRKKHKLTYKVIFDARGLWAEEVAFKKNYTTNNANYIFLKEIEKYLLDKSDSIISVSDTMQRHYEKLTQSKINTIYLSAPTTNLKNRTKQPSQAPTLIYIGALTKNTWHQPESLLKLYKKFKQTWDKQTHLIIVTTSNHAAIRLVFNEIPEEELTLCSTRTPKEMTNMLQKADFACLPYFTPTNYAEKKISKTMLAVKTVEYLSAGLPILCNKHCGGAAEIIKQYKLGISYSPEKVNEISPHTLQDLMHSSISKKAMKIANKLFSYQTNAIKYSDLYKSLQK